MMIALPLELMMKWMTLISCKVLVHCCCTVVDSQFGSCFALILIVLCSLKKQYQLNVSLLSNFLRFRCSLPFFEKGDLFLRVLFNQLLSHGNVSYI
jgi:hypothetical protein